MKNIILIVIFGFCLSKKLNSQIQNIERVYTSVSTEYIICWNGNNYISTLFRFNHSNLSNQSNCIDHTYLWSSTDLDLGYNSVNTNKDKSLYFNNECKSGKLKCTHKWKKVTEYNSNGTPKTFTDETENSEVTIKIVNSSTLTITGTSTIDCGKIGEYTYTINNLCSHNGTYNINWSIPSGWSFKNPADQYNSSKTIVLISDKNTSGQVSATVTSGYCFNSGWPTLPIDRPILYDRTLTGNLESDYVAFNTIKIQYSSSNPTVTTKVKAGSIITIKDGVSIYNYGNNYTQLAIGAVNGCNANKMALISQTKDSLKVDSNSKAINTLTSSKELELSIFPNPASDIVKLEFNNLKSKNLSIVLFDLMGRKIKEKIISNIDNDNLKTELDINELSNGNYVINIKTDNETKQSKLVIEK